MCNEGESEEPAGEDSNESVYEAERVEFGRCRTSHSGTGAAAPEQRNRSMRTASNRDARTNICSISSSTPVWTLATVGDTGALAVLSHCQGKAISSRDM
ncbi:unnamed protein product [Ectocarpus sp. CCAP 1310/34]|nr:unnamed protein product [Ectocarpus sp. CCAP 1310/34]